MTNDTTDLLPTDKFIEVTPKPDQVKLDQANLKLYKSAEQPVFPVEKTDKILTDLYKNITEYTPSPEETTATLWDNLGVNENSALAKAAASHGESMHSKDSGFLFEEQSLKGRLKAQSKIFADFLGSSKYTETDNIFKIDAMDISHRRFNSAQETSDFFGSFYKLREQSLDRMIDDLISSDDPAVKQKLLLLSDPNSSAKFKTGVLQSIASNTAIMAPSVQDAISALRSSGEAAITQLYGSRGKLLLDDMDDHFNRLTNSSNSSFVKYIDDRKSKENKKAEEAETNSVWDQGVGLKAALHKINKTVRSFVANKYLFNDEDMQDAYGESKLLDFFDWVEEKINYSSQVHNLVELKPVTSYSAGTKPDKAFEDFIGIKDVALTSNMYTQFKAGNFSDAFNMLGKGVTDVIGETVGDLAPAIALGVAVEKIATKVLGKNPIGVGIGVVAAVLAKIAYNSSVVVEEDLVRTKYELEKRGDSITDMDKAKALTGGMIIGSLDTFADMILVGLSPTRSLTSAQASHMTGMLFGLKRIAGAAAVEGGTEFVQEYAEEALHQTRLTPELSMSKIKGLFTENTSLFSSYNEDSDAIFSHFREGERFIYNTTAMFVNGVNGAIQGGLAGGAVKAGILAHAHSQDSELGMIRTSYNIDNRLETSDKFESFGGLVYSGATRSIKREIAESIISLQEHSIKDAGSVVTAFKYTPEDVSARLDSKLEEVYKDKESLLEMVNDKSNDNLANKGASAWTKLRVSHSLTNVDDRILALKEAKRFMNRIANPEGSEASVIQNYILSGFDSKVLNSEIDGYKRFIQFGNSLGFEKELSGKLKTSSNLHKDLTIVKKFAEKAVELQSTLSKKETIIGLYDGSAGNLDTLSKQIKSVEDVFNTTSFNSILSNATANPVAKRELTKLKDIISTQASIIKDVKSKISNSALIGSLDTGNTSIIDMAEILRYGNVTNTEVNDWYARAALDIYKTTPNNSYTLAEITDELKNVKFGVKLDKDTGLRRLSVDNARLLNDNPLLIKHIGKNLLNEVINSNTPSPRLQAIAGLFLSLASDQQMQLVTTLNSQVKTLKASLESETKVNFNSHTTSIINRATKLINDNAGHANNAVVSGEIANLQQRFDAIQTSDTFMPRLSADYGHYSTSLANLNAVLGGYPPSAKTDTDTISSEITSILGLNLNNVANMHNESDSSIFIRNLQANSPQLLNTELTSVVKKLEDLSKDNNVLKFNSRSTDSQIKDTTIKDLDYLLRQSSLSEEASSNMLQKAFNHFRNPNTNSVYVEFNNLSTIEEVIARGKALISFISSNSANVNTNAKAGLDSDLFKNESLHLVDAVKKGITNKIVDIFNKQNATYLTQISIGEDIALTKMDKIKLLTELPNLNLVKRAEVDSLFGFGVVKTEGNVNINKYKPTSELVKSFEEIKNTVKYNLAGVNENKAFSNSIVNTESNAAHKMLFKVANSLGEVFYGDKIVSESANLLDLKDKVHTIKNEFKVADTRVNDVVKVLHSPDSSDFDKILAHNIIKESERDLKQIRKEFIGLIVKNIEDQSTDSLVASINSKLQKNEFAYDYASGLSNLKVELNSNTDLSENSKEFLQAIITISDISESTAITTDFFKEVNAFLNTGKLEATSEFGKLVTGNELLKQFQSVFSTILTYNYHKNNILNVEQSNKFDNYFSKNALDDLGISNSSVVASSLEANKYFFYDLIKIHLNDKSVSWKAEVSTDNKDISNVTTQILQLKSDNLSQTEQGKNIPVWLDSVSPVIMDVMSRYNNFHLFSEAGLSPDTLYTEEDKNSTITGIKLLLEFNALGGRLSVEGKLSSDVAYKTNLVTLDGILQGINNNISTFVQNPLIAQQKDAVESFIRDNIVNNVHLQGAIQNFVTFKNTEHIFTTNYHRENDIPLMALFLPKDVIISRYAVSTETTVDLNIASLNPVTNRKLDAVIMDKLTDAGVSLAITTYLSSDVFKNNQRRRFAEIDEIVSHDLSNDLQNLSAIQADKVKDFISYGLSLTNTNLDSNEQSVFKLFDNATVEQLRVNIRGNTVADIGINIGTWLDKQLLNPNGSFVKALNSYINSDAKLVIGAYKESLKDSFFNLTDTSSVSGNIAQTVGRGIEEYVHKNLSENALTGRKGFKYRVDLNPAKGDDLTVINSVLKTFGNTSEIAFHTALRDVVFQHNLSEYEVLTKSIPPRLLYEGFNEFKLNFTKLFEESSQASDSQQGVPFVIQMLAPTKKLDDKVIIVAYFSMLSAISEKSRNIGAISVDSNNDDQDALISKVKQITLSGTPYFEVSNNLEATFISNLFANLGLSLNTPHNTGVASAMEEIQTSFVSTRSRWFESLLLSSKILTEVDPATFNELNTDFLKNIENYKSKFDRLSNGMTSDKPSTSFNTLSTVFKATELAGHTSTGLKERNNLLQTKVTESHFSEGMINYIKGGATVFNLLDRGLNRNDDISFIEPVDSTSSIKGVQAKLSSMTNNQKYNTLLSTNKLHLHEEFFMLHYYLSGIQKGEIVYDNSDPFHRQMAEMINSYLTHGKFKGLSDLERTKFNNMDVIKQKLAVNTDLVNRILNNINTYAEIFEPGSRRMKELINKNERTIAKLRATLRVQTPSLVTAATTPFFGNLIASLTAINGGVAPTAVELASIENNLRNILNTKSTSKNLNAHMSETNKFYSGLAVNANYSSLFSADHGGVLNSKHNFLVDYNNNAGLTYAGLPGPAINSVLPRMISAFSVIPAGTLNIGPNRTFENVRQYDVLPFLNAVRDSIVSNPYRGTSIVIHNKLEAMRTFLDGRIATIRALPAGTDFSQFATELTDTFFTPDASLGGVNFMSYVGQGLSQISTTSVSERQIPQQLLNSQFVVNVHAGLLRQIRQFNNAVSPAVNTVVLIPAQQMLTNVEVTTAVTHNIQPLYNGFGIGLKKDYEHTVEHPFSENDFYRSLLNGTGFNALVSGNANNMHTMSSSLFRSGRGITDNFSTLVRETFTKGNDTNTYDRIRDLERSNALLTGPVTLANITEKAREMASIPIYIKRMMSRNSRHGTDEQMVNYQGDKAWLRAFLQNYDGKVLDSYSSDSYAIRQEGEEWAKAMAVATDNKGFNAFSPQVYVSLLTQYNLSKMLFGDDLLKYSLYAYNQTYDPASLGSILNFSNKITRLMSDESFNDADMLGMINNLFGPNSHNRIQKLLNSELFTQTKHSNILYLEELRSYLTALSDTVTPGSPGTALQTIANAGNPTLALELLADRSNAVAVADFKRNMTKFVIPLIAKFNAEHKGQGRRFLADFFTRFRSLEVYGQDRQNVVKSIGKLVKEDGLGMTVQDITKFTNSDIATETYGRTTNMLLHDAPFVSRVMHEIDGLGNGPALSTFESLPTEVWDHVYSDRANRVVTRITNVAGNGYSNFLASMQNTLTSDGNLYFTPHLMLAGGTPLPIWANLSIAGGRHGNNMNHRFNQQLFDLYTHATALTNTPLLDDPASGHITKALASNLLAENLILKGIMETPGSSINGMVVTADFLSDKVVNGLNLRSRLQNLLTAMDTALVAGPTAVDTIYVNDLNTYINTLLAGTPVLDLTKANNLIRYAIQAKVNAQLSPDTINDAAKLGLDSSSKFLDIYEIVGKALAGIFIKGNRLPPFMADIFAKDLTRKLMKYPNMTKDYNSADPSVMQLHGNDLAEAFVSDWILKAVKLFDKPNAHTDSVNVTIDGAGKKDLEVFKKFGNFINEYTQYMTSLLEQSKEQSNFNFAILQGFKSDELQAIPHHISRLKQIYNNLWGANNANTTNNSAILELEKLSEEFESDSLGATALGKLEGSYITEAMNYQFAQKNSLTGAATQVALKTADIQQIAVKQLLYLDQSLKFLDSQMSDHTFFNNAPIYELFGSNKANLTKDIFNYLVTNHVLENNERSFKDLQTRLEETLRLVPDSSGTPVVTGKPITFKLNGHSIKFISSQQSLGTTVMLVHSTDGNIMGGTAIQSKMDNKLRSYNFFDIYDAQMIATKDIAKTVEAFNNEISLMMMSNAINVNVALQDIDYTLLTADDRAELGKLLYANLNDLHDVSASLNPILNSSVINGPDTYRLTTVMPNVRYTPITEFSNFFRYSTNASIESLLKTHGIAKFRNTLVGDTNAQDFIRNQLLNENPSRQGQRVFTEDTINFMKKHFITTKTVMTFYNNALDIAKNVISDAYNLANTRDGGIGYSKHLADSSQALKTAVLDKATNETDKLKLLKYFYNSRFISYTSRLTGLTQRMDITTYAELFSQMAKKSSSVTTDAVFTEYNERVKERDLNPYKDDHISSQTTAVDNAPSNIISSLTVAHSDNIGSMFNNSLPLNTLSPFITANGLANDLLLVDLKFEGVAKELHHSYRSAEDWIKLVGNASSSEFTVLTHMMDMLNLSLPVGTRINIPNMLNAISRYLITNPDLHQKIIDMLNGKTDILVNGQKFRMNEAVANQFFISSLSSEMKTLSLQDASKFMNGLIKNVNLRNTFTRFLVTSVMDSSAHIAQTKNNKRLIMNEYLTAINAGRLDNALNNVAISVDSVFKAEFIKAMEESGRFNNRTASNFFLEEGGLTFLTVGYFNDPTHSFKNFKDAYFSNKTSTRLATLDKILDQVAPKQMLSMSNVLKTSLEYKSLEQGAAKTLEGAVDFNRYYTKYAGEYIWRADLHQYQKGSSYFADNRISSFNQVANAIKNEGYLSQLELIDNVIRDTPKNSSYYITDSSGTPLNAKDLLSSEMGFTQRALNMNSSVSHFDSVDSFSNSITDVLTYHKSKGFPYTDKGIGIIHSHLEQFKKYKFPVKPVFKVAYSNTVQDFSALRIYQNPTDNVIYVENLPLFLSPQIIMLKDVHDSGAYEKLVNRYFTPIGAGVRDTLGTQSMTSNVANYDAPDPKNMVMFLSGLANEYKNSNNKYHMDGVENHISKITDNIMALLNSENLDKPEVPGYDVSQMFPGTYISAETRKLFRRDAANTNASGNAKNDQILSFSDRFKRDMAFLFKSQAEAEAADVAGAVDVKFAEESYQDNRDFFSISAYRAPTSDVRTALNSNLYPSDTMRLKALQFRRMYMQERYKKAMIEVVNNYNELFNMIVNEAYYQFIDTIPAGPQRDLYTNDSFKVFFRQSLGQVVNKMLFKDNKLKDIYIYDNTHGDILQISDLSMNPGRDLSTPVSKTQTSGTDQRYGNAKTSLLEGMYIKPQFMSETFGGGLYDDTSVTAAPRNLHNRHGDMYVGGLRGYVKGGESGPELDPLDVPTDDRFKPNDTLSLDLHSFSTRPRVYSSTTVNNLIAQFKALPIFQLRNQLDITNQAEKDLASQVAVLGTPGDVASKEIHGSLNGATPHTYYTNVRTPEQNLVERFPDTTKLIGAEQHVNPLLNVASPVDHAPAGILHLLNRGTPRRYVYNVFHNRSLRRYRANVDLTSQHREDVIHTGDYTYQVPFTGMFDNIDSVRKMSYATSMFNVLRKANHEVYSVEDTIDQVDDMFGTKLSNYKVLEDDYSVNLIAEPYKNMDKVFFNGLTELFSRVKEEMIHSQYSNLMYTIASNNKVREDAIAYTHYAEFFLNKINAFGIPGKYNPGSDQHLLFLHFQKHIGSKYPNFGFGTDKFSFKKRAINVVEFLNEFDAALRMLDGGKVFISVGSHNYGDVESSLIKNAIKNVDTSYKQTLDDIKFKNADTNIKLDGNYYIHEIDNNLKMDTSVMTAKDAKVGFDLFKDHRYVSLIRATDHRSKGTTKNNLIDTGGGTSFRASLLFEADDKFMDVAPDNFDSQAIQIKSINTTPLAEKGTTFNELYALAKFTKLMERTNSNFNNLLKVASNNTMVQNEALVSRLINGKIASNPQLQTDFATYMDSITKFKGMPVSTVNSKYERFNVTERGFHPFYSMLELGRLDSTAYSPYVEITDKSIINTKPDENMLLSIGSGVVSNTRNAFSSFFGAITKSAEVEEILGTLDFESDQKITNLQYDGIAGTKLVNNFMNTFVDNTTADLRAIFNRSKVDVGSKALLNIVSQVNINNVVGKLSSLSGLDSQIQALNFEPGVKESLINLAKFNAGKSTQPLTLLNSASIADKFGISSKDVSYALNLYALKFGDFSNYERDLIDIILSKSNNNLNRLFAGIEQINTDTRALALENKDDFVENYLNFNFLKSQFEFTILNAEQYKQIKEGKGDLQWELVDELAKGLYLVKRVNLEAGEVEGLFKNSVMQKSLLKDSIFNETVKETYVKSGLGNYIVKLRNDMYKLILPNKVMLNAIEKIEPHLKYADTFVKVLSKTSESYQLFDHFNELNDRIRKTLISESYSPEAIMFKSSIPVVDANFEEVKPEDIKNFDNRSSLFKDTTHLYVRKMLKPRLIGYTEIGLSKSFNSDALRTFKMVEKLFKGFISLAQHNILMSPVALFTNMIGGAMQGFVGSGLKNPLKYLALANEGRKKLTEFRKIMSEEIKKIYSEDLSRDAKLKINRDSVLHYLRGRMEARLGTEDYALLTSNVFSTMFEDSVIENIGGKNSFRDHVIDGLFVNIIDKVPLLKQTLAGVVTLPLSLLNFGNISGLLSRIWGPESSAKSILSEAFLMPESLSGKVMGGIMGYTDFVHRYAVYSAQKDAIGKNKPSFSKAKVRDMAFQRAGDTLVDYAKTLPPVYRALGQYGLLPFATFMVRNAKFLTKVIYNSYEDDGYKAFRTGNTKEVLKNIGYVPIASLLMTNFLGLGALQSLTLNADSYNLMNSYLTFDLTNELFDSVETAMGTSAEGSSTSNIDKLFSGYFASNMLTNPIDAGVPGYYEALYNSVSEQDMDKLFLK